MEPRFNLIITEVHRDNGTEIGRTEDGYDFYLEALAVAQSVSAGYFVDEKRVELARGEKVTYEAVQCNREIQIKET